MFCLIALWTKLDKTIFILNNSNHLFFYLYTGWFAILLIFFFITTWAVVNHT